MKNKRKKHQINLDTDFYNFQFLRGHIEQGENDIKSIIDKISILNNNALTFVEYKIFLEELFLESYGKQRNNHNFMRTFLSEKVTTHKQIPISSLDSIISKNKITYSNNVSPKKIMSNYILSNKSEEKLNVKDLEDTFIGFTRSERFLLSKEDIYRQGKSPHSFLIKLSDDTYIPIKNPVFEMKVNDKLKNDTEIDNLKKYFALQLSRRDFFLQHIIDIFLKFSKKTSTNLDLFDYLFIKFIYNKALLVNNNNWLNSLSEHNIVTQRQYFMPKTLRSFQETKKIPQRILLKNVLPKKLAIGEANTIHFLTLIEMITVKKIRKELKRIGLSYFSLEEQNNVKDIIVSIGSNDKLCFLSKKDISNNLFDKIDHIIHFFWDKCMLKLSLKHILLSQDSELNTINVLKNISNSTINEANIFNNILELSEKNEVLIHKSSQNNLTISKKM